MSQRLSPFQTRSRRAVWSCPWYSVRQDEILLPNGQSGQYNVVQHPGAVWIVPVTVAGEIVLIFQYRYAVDSWCWEVPAGGLKEGYSLEEIARLELREEVGGTAGEWRHIGQFYPGNGYSNEVAHIFLARDVTIASPAHEPAEVMEVHIVPMERALEMARGNEMSDGSSALALLRCEPYLK